MEKLRVGPGFVADTLIAMIIDEIHLLLFLLSFLVSKLTKAKLSFNLSYLKLKLTRRWSLELKCSTIVLGKSFRSTVKSQD